MTIPQGSGTSLSQTLIAGNGCGLYSWQGRSAVAHATPVSVDEPHKKQGLARWPSQHKPVTRRQSKPTIVGIYSTSVLHMDPAAHRHQPATKRPLHFRLASVSTNAGAYAGGDSCSDIVAPRGRGWAGLPVVCYNAALLT
jgi:hypothetical protein